MTDDVFVVNVVCKFSERILPFDKKGVFENLLARGSNSSINLRERADKLSLKKNL